LVLGKQEVNKNLPLFLTLLIRKLVPIEKFGTFETKFGINLKIGNLPSKQFLHFHLVPPWV
jgi:hypothetical protein